MQREKYKTYDMGNIWNVDFSKLEFLLAYWREIEFPYNWNIYSILYFQKHWVWDVKWHFLCDKLNINIEICLFEEIEKLINFLKEHKINWKTVEEIFNEEKFHEDVLGIY